jgi:hypothetical protein
MVGDAQPVINSFTASANAILAGGSLTLNWDTSNASALTLDGNPLAPTAAGSLTLNPTATHTYTLSATNSACATPQTVSAQVTVTVADCPAIDFFTANPATVIAGRSATLSWATRNSSGVFLDGLPVAPAGSRSVTPNSAATYRLTARSASGLCDLEQLAGVPVTPCPAPVTRA